MSDRPYVVISADGHCGADLWDYRPYLESRYHDEFDAWAASYSDAWEALDPDAGDRRVGAASYTSNYNWDSALRWHQLESEGIVAEVLFPNTAPPFYPSGAITAPPPATKAEYECPDPPIHLSCLVGDEDAGAAWAGKMFLLREHRDQLEETPARCDPAMPRARSTSRSMIRT